MAIVLPLLSLLITVWGVLNGPGKGFSFGLYSVVVVLISSFGIIGIFMSVSEAMAMGKPSFVQGVMMEGTEREWGYGQILPMLLLALPVLNALEIYNGRYLTPERLVS